MMFWRLLMPPWPIILRKVFHAWHSLVVGLACHGFLDEHYPSIIFWSFFSPSALDFPNIRLAPLSYLICFTLTTHLQPLHTLLLFIWLYKLSALDPWHPSLRNYTWTQWSQIERTERRMRLKGSIAVGEWVTWEMGKGGKKD